jgi:hypothetical protein
MLLRHLQRVSTVQGSINIIKGRQFPSETSSLLHLSSTTSDTISKNKSPTEGVEMLTFRNEKQRLRYLRCTSSGPIIFQDPRNGNISGTSTSDLESLEKEMDRLRLQARLTPKATASTMAHRRFVIFPVYRSCY